MSRRCNCTSPRGFAFLSARRADWRATSYSRQWGTSLNDELVDFFAGFPDSRPIFDALRVALDELGRVEMRVTRSQISFRRRVAFAWAWVPDRYLRGGHAPLVLSVALRRRDGSPRWKEIVQPAPGRFMHHLELYSSDGIDDEVRGWLTEAWIAAA